MADRVPEKVRRVLVACGGVALFALLLAATVAALVPRPVPPPVHPGYALIRDGMTEPEVEALLGGPRGPHDPALWNIRLTSACGFGPRGHTSYWYFPGHKITVYFDGSGHVRDKEVGPPPPAGPAVRAWQWAAEWWQP
jgi:hypothetical protein